MRTKPGKGQFYALFALLRQTPLCFGAVESGKRSRQILAAAARVFARQGYQAARVGDIAQEAGAAHGLVYHYFDSKEAVLEAVVRDAWGRLLAAIESAEESGPDGAQPLCLLVKSV